MIKKCKVGYCKREPIAKGYCSNHYHHILKYGRLSKKSRRKQIIKYCRVKKCIHHIYARNLCRNHYTLWRRNGTSIRIYKNNKNQLCKVPNCNKPALSKLFCQLHYWRHLHNLPLICKKYKSYVSKRMITNNPNPYWEKGKHKFMYPNHYEMKLMRKLKVKRVKGRCQKCSRKGQKIFHKDLNKSNHKYKNLIFLCNRCFYKKWIKIHLRKTNKYVKIYGMTLTKLGEKLNISTQLIWHKHKLNQLQEYKI